MRRGVRRRAGRRSRRPPRSSGGSSRSAGAARSRPRGAVGRTSERMRRREFLRRAGVAAAGLAWGRPSSSGTQSSSAHWRTFEITTRVEILQSSPTTRVWLPTPLPDAPYQRTLGDTYHAVGGRAVMIERVDEPDTLGAEWEDGNPAVLTLTSRVATTDRAVDL